MPECMPTSLDANPKRSARLKKRRLCPAVVFAALVFSVLSFPGCGQKSRHNDYLVRVENYTVTVSEFNRAVETTSEEVFAGEGEIEKAALNDLRMRVLNQFVEELMIREKASQLGIAVTDDELEKAVSAIQADYPDDTFKETLLENAVSFEAWKRKLAARLLAEKVISKELESQVQITSKDVADYYKRYYPDGHGEDQDIDSLNKKIVTHLRRQKAEQGYKAWIEGLRQSMAVEINQDAWVRLTATR